MLQLVDDLLDFVSNEELMGKPAADLKLGLATGPVLFAAQEVSRFTVYVPKQEQVHYISPPVHPSLCIPP